jgi:hypothetical protein
MSPTPTVTPSVSTSVSVPAPVATPVVLAHVPGPNPAGLVTPPKPTATGLPKNEHWLTRSFNQFLIANAKTPFAWGTNDCCMFAANAILANTGIDIATDFRGKYSDEASAFALIATVTGVTNPTVADAAAHCAAEHGLVEYKHSLMAKRGDLVVISNGGTLICGVVHLNGRQVISVSQSGAVRLPISNVVRSWSV